LTTNEANETAPDLIEVIRELSVALNQACHHLAAVNHRMVVAPAEVPANLDIGTGCVPSRKVNRHLTRAHHMTKPRGALQVIRRKSVMPTHRLLDLGNTNSHFMNLLRVPKHQPVAR
jgi:hypothetical protein